MKNKLVFLVILLLLLVSIFFNVYLYTSLNSKIDKKDDEIKQLEKKYVDVNTQLEESDRKVQRFSRQVNETLVELKYNEVADLFKGKETFVIVLTQANCWHCQEYLPVFEEALKEENRSAYFVDIEHLTRNEEKEVKKYLSYSGTPTTYYVKNGEIQNDLTKVGGESKESIIERLNTLYK